MRTRSQDQLRGVLREHKQALALRVAGPSRADMGDLAGLALKAGAMVNRQDDWMNMYTGQGVEGMDVRRRSKSVWRGLLMTEHEQESIVAGNNLARRIVELLPYEGTRKWIKLINLDDHERDLRDELDRLQLRQHCYTGWCWSRQFGGAGTLIVTDEPDEDLSKPLVLGRFKRVENLVTFNRWELEAWNSDIDTNLRSPNFRLPIYYRLNVSSGGRRIPVNVKIHHSRIIRWGGSSLGPLLFIRNKYWEDSVFSGLMDSLGNWDRSTDGIAAVLEHFRFVVHKMPEIADLVSKGEYAKVLNRVRAAAASRSLFGTMVADKEEEITSVSETFAGVPDILDRLADNLAAKTEYPKIILFNSSPDGGGMSGKGFPELQGWYSTVGARQSTFLAPRLDQLLAAVLGAPEGPCRGVVPEDWDYEFEELSVETKAERATREKTEAEGDELRMNQGVQDEVDVMARRFPDKIKGQDPEALRLEIEEQKQLQLALEMERLKAAPKPEDAGGGGEPGGQG